MKFVDEFRNEEYSKNLVKQIQNITRNEISIMEVCGTHTMSIFKYGIRDILPPNIKLLSGPGCPVCVTPQSYIDMAIKLSEMDNVVITTFGDMMRVPGKNSSLIKKRAEGADIRVVYSHMDALYIAQNEPNKKIVFLSVGFETTTPMTAITATEAKKVNVKNLFFLTANKLMPPAMKSLVEDKSLNINGFLLPGHVSAITGIHPFSFLSKIYNIPAVVAGFEPLDILSSLKTLLDIINSEKKEVVNGYKRIVRNDGNLIAQEYLQKVFDICDSRWRGIGVIPASGYKFNKEFEEFDAQRHFDLNCYDYDGSAACRCGEILKGKISPLECPLFNVTCTPENPVGACMVSTEGTCAAYYKYSSRR